MEELPIPLARCPKRFSDMTPDGPRSRFCASCERSVHDLSAMSRAEAARLLRRSDDVCVRYLHDGRRVVHAGRAKRALAVAAILAAPLLTEACGGAPGRYDYTPAHDQHDHEPDEREDR